MNPTKYKGVAIIFCVGFIVSSLALVVLAYWHIDQSVTLAYARSGQEATARSLFRISTLLETEWRGLPEAELMRRLEIEAGRHPESDILLKKDTKESVIWFDDVRFEIEDGKMKRIVY